MNDKTNGELKAVDSSVNSSRHEDLPQERRDSRTHDDRVDCGVNADSRRTRDAAKIRHLRKAKPTGKSIKQPNFLTGFDCEAIAFWMFVSCCVCMIVLVVMAGIGFVRNTEQEVQFSTWLLGTPYTIVLSLLIFSAVITVGQRFKLTN